MGRRLEKVQWSSVIVSGISYMNKLNVQVHWFIYMLYVFVFTSINTLKFKRSDL